uniref:Ovule protein n=1 Tax=Mesocestoides corti TaxID=53468 RepID=A0A5K3G5L6_MESCO
MSITNHSTSINSFFKAFLPQYLRSTLSHNASPFFKQLHQQHTTNDVSSGSRCFLSTCSLPPRICLSYSSL